MDIYDSAVAYCQDLGIPESEIDAVIEKAELCCEGPNGDGCCAENTKFIIDSEAERLNSASTAIESAAANVACVGMLMFVLTIFSLAVILPDHTEGRVSVGAVQEVIR